MAETAVDFLLDNLEELQSSRAMLNPVEKKQVESVYEDLKIIRAFLKDSEEKYNEHEEVKNLVTQIGDVACEVLDDLDSLVFSHRFDCVSRVRNFRQEIKFNIKKKFYAMGIPQTGHVFDQFSKHIGAIKYFKEHVTQIYDSELYDIGVPQPQFGISSEGSLSRASSPSLEEEQIVVGFDDEATAIVERLTGEQKKQLEIISIVGMGGLGKTTLARKVYNDPFIVYHFYVRGWTCVSPVYQKNDMLLGILSSVVGKKDEIYKMSNEKLGELLYKRLKGQRFLIVMDDIWNLGAWDDLRNFFPNDNNGSRIMVTTRLTDVALQIKPDSAPHCLHFLTQNQSWGLLQYKAFGKGSCPPELMDIGRQIAAKCGGLPLAIVVVAGFLAKREKTQDQWNQVARSVSSYIDGEAEQFINILALSYDHLPHHLKSCFLYFGASPKYYEISVRKLIWLWIAEGFVQQIGQRSLEDVAADCLMDLIDRNLVVVVEKRFDGGIKVCRIHDMLRDLCLSKAKERNFPQEIDDHGLVSSPSTPIADDYLFSGSDDGLPHLSQKPQVTGICYHFMSATKRNPYPKHTKPFIYKLLRVLDLWGIYLNYFPNEILQLFHLRYLELCVNYLDMLPIQISNLRNLETLIIHKVEQGKVTIPRSVWNMVKLRHIRISSGVEFEKPHSIYGYPFVLDNLQTISALLLSNSSKVAKDILARIPNLRKLEFYQDADRWKEYHLPDLSNFIHLHTLKFIDNSRGPPLPNIPEPNKFPPNLKKLTLSGGCVDWEEISNLGKLPNLEVLKLRNNIFYGPRWETIDGEFQRLKYLKLSWMNLQQWITSSSHFPSLQLLVLERCRKLEEIPLSLGDIPTLQMIQIYWSSHSAEKSARQIQEEQQSMGNDGLKILINPSNQE